MGALLPDSSVAPRKAGAEAAAAAAVTRKLRRDTRMARLSLSIKKSIIDTKVETRTVSQPSSLVRDRRCFRLPDWGRRTGAIPGATSARLQAEWRCFAVSYTLP